MHGRRLLSRLRRVIRELDMLCDREETGDPAMMLGAFMEPIERELLEAWVMESMGAFMQWAFHD